MPLLRLPPVISRLRLPTQMVHHRLPMDTIRVREVPQLQEQTPRLRMLMQHIGKYLVLPIFHFTNVVRYEMQGCVWL